MASTTFVVLLSALVVAVTGAPQIRYEQDVEAPVYPLAVETYRPIAAAQQTPVAYRNPVAYRPVAAAPSPVAYRQVAAAPSPVAYRQVAAAPNPVAYRQVAAAPNPVAYRPIAAAPNPVAYRQVAAAPAPLTYNQAADPNYDPNPQYAFSYSVDDPESGDSKSHEEERNGDSVQGRYSLIEADGSRRIVEYTADPVSGFNAVVHKEAGAAPPPPVRAAYQPLQVQPAFKSIAAPAPAPVLRYNKPTPVVQYNTAPVVEYEPIQQVPAVRLASAPATAAGVRSSFSAPFGNFAY